MPCLGFLAAFNTRQDAANCRDNRRYMRKVYSRPEARPADARGETSERVSADLQAWQRRRSTRMRLQIPVQARFHNPDGAEVRLDAFTLVVNAHGCLLEMEVKPPVGKRMRLRNTKSQAEQTGTVIQSERSRDGLFAVAFEFDSPVPQLWPIVEPPEDWEFSR